MSLEAAKEFGLSHDEFIEFLNGVKAENLDTTKNVVVIVSLLLLTFALFITGIALFLWFYSKTINSQSENEDKFKADLACDEEALKDSIKSSLKVPQVSNSKSRYSPDIAFPDKLVNDEELKNIRVQDIELTSVYYAHRKRMQVNLRRLNLENIHPTLLRNAYIYWIVYLLPEKTTYFESELRPCAEENYFEEACEFEIELADISSRQLQLSVYACDRFSQHRLVNEQIFKLDVLSTDDASIKPINMQLIKNSNDDDVFVEEKKQNGEVLFSLCYMPTSGRLTFVALKGKHLCKDFATPIATYLRVSLLVSGKTMKTVQTSSVRHSSNPVYNEAFVFHAPLERFKDTDIIISVMTYDPNKTAPKMLGKIIVGPESDSNLGRKHWEAMLVSPRKPVAQWHTLVNFL